MSQITSFFNGSGSGTVASVTGGNGINITGNPSLNPTVNITAPVSIANGGTNAITMTNANGVNYFDGTRIVTTTVGTAGQVLVSNGVGMPPTFQSFAPGGVVSVSGAHNITITGAPATPTVNLTNTVTIGDLAVVTGDTLKLTSGDITLSATGVGATGNINLPDTTSATVGVITLDGARFFHAYGSDSNLFIGDDSGNFTLTPLVATDNTAVGEQTLQSLTTGTDNTAIGVFALRACTTGDDNMAAGGGALQLLTTGSENTAIGIDALLRTTTGNDNVALGTASLGNLTTTSNNTAVGWNSGINLVTGANNTLVGSQAGVSYTTNESSNIIIKNNGTILDNNTIRIGTQGNGAGQQNLCFIAGITGVTTSNSNMVTIDTTTGQLGAASMPATFTWSVITADQNASVNNGYICNKAGTLTLTLPASSAVGDIIEVTGINTNLGWKIAQNGGQTIYIGNAATTTGATGYIASSQTRDSVRLVCVVANTDWNAVPGVQGNITVV